MRKSVLFSLVCLLLCGMFVTAQAGDDAFAENKARAKSAFDALKYEYPGVQTYQNDGRTTRIYGRPFAFGNSPEDAAEQFRMEHAAILEAETPDLVAVNADKSGRTVQPVMYDPATGQYKFSLVYYSQMRDNIPVFRSELRLLVKNDYNYPVVLAVSSLKNLGDASFANKSSVDANIAYQAIENDHPYLKDFSEPETVIWAGYEEIHSQPRLAISMVAENEFPEKWLYVVDAETGEILYKEDQIIMTNVTGTVNGLATEGHGADICADEVPTPLPYIRANIGSSSAYTNTDGEFTIPNSGSTPVTVESELNGQYFDVYNEAGAEAYLSEEVTPPGPADFLHNQSNSEYTTAEVNGYIHANVVRDYVLKYNPSYPTIAGQTNFPVFVNRSDGYCPGNAWYDGSSINFCKSGPSNPNTGFSTIIHHEYGHHVVATGGSGQGQYGEGMADVMGLLIFDESGTGFGFSGSCGVPLRDADNSIQYPCGNEIHFCGQVISGCVWETRNELMVSNPADYRDIISSLAINAVMLHTGTEITPQITIDYLTLDDDDGNLNNRTPHFDQINDGFSLHNMAYPEPPQVIFVDANLTDAGTGNGNGVFEAGETCQINFSIADNNISTVTDLSVTLTTDDDNLALTDDYIFFGAIATNDTLDNSAGPFTIDIPANYASRVDSFYLEAHWIGELGEKYDTMVIVNDIGAVSLLLVDDDNFDDLEKYYDHYLSNARIPYDIWSTSTQGSPSGTLLNQYDVVVWYTGDYRVSPLNSSKISAMETYMDAGGQLLLSGQGIAAQLNSFDPTFLNDYLHASYASTSVLPIVSGTASSQIINQFDSLAIIGFGGAGNQTNPDHIQATNGGTPEMVYFNASDYGAVSYSGAYKLLFCSFGFEAIVNFDNRWVERDTVFARVLDFFNYNSPGTIPRILDLTVPGEDVMRLTDHTPDFAWTYYDQDGLPQQKYQVQVGTDQDWSLAELWDYGPFDGAVTQVTYDGGELLDGERYYVRARVFNGIYWSSWFNLEMRMNSTPAIPTNRTPDNLKAVLTDHPYLIHDNSFDKEGGTLTYSYELYDDVNMTTLIASAYNQPEDPGSTSEWEVDVALTDDHEYFWRTRANDGLEDGQWSSLASFWVNSINLNPEPFALISPANGATGSDLSPTFTWEKTVDNDLIDTVAYDLAISGDSLFGTALFVYHTSDTTYNFTGSLQYGTVYYWRVRAYDLYGGETFSPVNSLMPLLSDAGDANGDGVINIGDAVYVVNYVFKSGPAPDPESKGDANCDLAVNVGDAVYIVNYVFKGGPAPGCN